MDCLTGRLCTREQQNLIHSLGSSIDPHTLMGNLSVAEQQVVEIAKSCFSRCTDRNHVMNRQQHFPRESVRSFIRSQSSLEEKESPLYLSLTDWKICIVLADRVTVFRDASYIGTWDIKDVTK